MPPGPLLARWNARTASLVLGVIWALWHSISFLQTSDSLSWIFWQSVNTVGLRVLLVGIARAARLALHQHGEEPLFHRRLHTMTNVSEFSFPVFGSHYDPFIFTMLIAIAVAIVIAVWGVTLGGRRVIGS